MAKSNDDNDTPSDRGPPRERDSGADFSSVVRERDKEYAKRDRERAKQAGQVFERVITLMGSMSKMEVQVSELFSRDAYRQAKVTELEADVSTLRQDLKSVDEKLDELLSFNAKFLGGLTFGKWLAGFIGIGNIALAIYWLVKH